MTTPFVRCISREFATGSTFLRSPLCYEIASDDACSLGAMVSSFLLSIHILPLCSNILWCSYIAVRTCDRIGAHSPQAC